MIGLRCLGLDTSNYTTSVAVFDGTTGENIGRLLDVPSGTLGLRQSDALFQHVKRLPGLLSSSMKRICSVNCGPWAPAPVPERWTAPTCPAFWPEKGREEPCPPL